jgi:hypothetical protein
MQLTIGEIVEQVKIVTPDTKCKEVYRHFQKYPKR